MTALSSFGNGPVSVQLVFCEKQIGGLQFCYNNNMVLPIEGDTITCLNFLSDRQKMLVVWVMFAEHKFTQDKLPLKDDLCDFIADILFPQTGDPADFNIDDISWPSSQVKDFYNSLMGRYIESTLWEVVWREFIFDKEGTVIELWLDTID